MIQIIQADGRAEQARIAAMRARAAEVGADIEEAVSAVMGAVKEKGLSAVEAYSLKFDGKIPYENPREELEAAYAAHDQKPDNVKVCTFDIERIANVFSPSDRVGRIYINFCNPWSKNSSKKKHRLTHGRQLLSYRTYLEDGGEIWFKTDDDDLFNDTLQYLPACGYEITWQTRDLHENEPSWNLRTEHEGMFTEQGIKIKALIARKLPDGEGVIRWNKALEKSIDGPFLPEE